MSQGATRSYAIIGAGALGGYFGARLHHGGLGVHFLLHSDYEHVKRRGLKVESCEGDFSIAHPSIFDKARHMPRCDVVLVGLKSTANDLLPAILPHVVNERAAVLVMQNGLGMEEQVARIVGPTTAVVGGMAFLCSNKVGPGHIRHLDYGQVRVGQHTPDGRPAGVTDAMRLIAEDFRRASVPVDVEEDLVLARWKKLVWNIPYNGLTVVHNTTTDELMRNPQTRELCESIMREVVAGAAGFGRVVEETFVQQMLTNTDKMVAYKPSMKLDYESGRAMELEAIYGNPLRAAASRGVQMPRVRELYEQLKAVDACGGRDGIS